MEDQNNPLAPLDPAIQARHEKTRRELERRKLDRCKVHNNTDETFSVTYNGYANPVAPHSDAVFFRYIAEPFAIKLVDHILTSRAEEEVKKLNAERESRGQSKLVRMDKNEVYARPEFNINNIENRRPLMKEIWKGVVEEFGMNQAIVEQQQMKQADTRPVDEQLFDEIDKENLVRAESDNDNLEITSDTPIEDLPLA